jgi:hypothetical protein
LEQYDYLEQHHHLEQHNHLEQPAVTRAAFTFGTLAMVRDANWGEELCSLTK